MSISSYIIMSSSMCIMKKENTIFLIQKSSKNVFVNFLIIKNKEYLTEENSCFVIFTSYLNKHLCRHCKFPNECPFLSLREVLIKFFGCEEGPSFEGGIHLGQGAVSDNYSMYKLIVILYSFYCNLKSNLISLMSE